jgi:hypothetical protein
VKNVLFVTEKEKNMIYTAICGKYNTVYAECLKNVVNLLVA